MSPENTEVITGRERPAFFQERLLDVSRTVSGVRLNRRFIGNADLSSQVPGWPGEVDAGIFCLFSIPRAGRELSPPKAKTEKRNVRVGTGRGLSSLHLPLPGSELALKLAGQEARLRPGMVGVEDPETGMFYTVLTTKGNGPTADEMERVIGRLGDAQLRIKKEDPWGILWAITARTVEQPRLDALALRGFRMGRVIGYFILDGRALAQEVDPHYEDAGLIETYSVARELAKGPTYNPAIMIRLGGGVRADVMASPKADPRLVEEAVYGWASEIKRGGFKAFIKRYRLPDSLHPSIRLLQDFDYSDGLNTEKALAYLKILSFLMGRNYYLQDEHNENLRSATEGPSPSDGLGSVWLNYKPGDWDLGGFMFDTDVFPFKRSLAAQLGTERLRRSDMEAMRAGLNYIGSSLSRFLPMQGRGNPDWQRCIEEGLGSAKRVSKTRGFQVQGTGPEFTDTTA